MAPPLSESRGLSQGAVDPLGLEDEIVGGPTYYGGHVFFDGKQCYYYKHEPGIGLFKLDVPCPPEFNLNDWNRINPSTGNRNRNNCYGFACNDNRDHKDDPLGGKPQPGDAAGKPMNLELRFEGAIWWLDTLVRKSKKRPKQMGSYLSIVTRALYAQVLATKWSYSSEKNWPKFLYEVGRAYWFLLEQIITGPFLAVAAVDVSNAG